MSAPCRARIDLIPISQSPPPLRSHGPPYVSPFAPSTKRFVVWRPILISTLDTSHAARFQAPNTCLTYTEWPFNIPPTSSPSFANGREFGRHSAEISSKSARNKSECFRFWSLSLPRYWSFLSRFFFNVGTIEKINHFSIYLWILVHLNKSWIVVTDIYSNLYEKSIQLFRLANYLTFVSKCMIKIEQK